MSSAQAPVKRRRGPSRSGGAVSLFRDNFQDGRSLLVEHPEVLAEGMVFVLETYWPSTAAGARRVEEELL